MKSTGRCPKCQSTDILANVKAVDRGHGDAARHLSLAVFADPDAFVFTGEERSTVSAWVCATCGYVEFYANSPDLLKQVREESLRRKG